MGKTRIELPLTESMYKTYHSQGAGTAIISSNPSIRNWLLNEALVLQCNCKFLDGYTTPEINIKYSTWPENPYLEKKWCTVDIIGGYVNNIIRSMLKKGYYASYFGIDDFYIQGKTWYGERHFRHDGLICGYDSDTKEYCLYAYDKEWMYRKFWTPQSGLDKGRKSELKKGKVVGLCFMKPLMTQIDFSAEAACERIAEYMETAILPNPTNGEDTVYGIGVQDYMVRYLEKLIDESIPYERMDYRIFRLIWEHKKVMLERIQLIESKMDMDSECSEKYTELVGLSDKMRMLYASHHRKRRDSVLHVIKSTLTEVRYKEESILKCLLIKSGGAK